jgi:L-fucose isomerase-like protein
MALGDIDFMKMKRDLGPEIVEFDSYSLIRLMEKQDLDGDEFKKNVAEITASLGSPLGKRLEKITCMYSAIKELIVKAYANAVTIKCNFELSQEFGLTACIPLSVLGNQIVASCEADIPAVLTQLLLHFLSDGKVSTYADIHEILDDRILVAACGFAPGAMCIDQKVIPDMPSDNPEGLGATFGDYITNKNYFNPGQVTMCRLLKEPDGKFSFHAARGVAVGNVGRVSEIGCPQYPFTEIRLSTDVDTFAQNLGSHHYAIVYGDLSRELDLFCQIKGMNLILE